MQLIQTNNVLQNTLRMFIIILSNSNQMDINIKLCCCFLCISFRFIFSFCYQNLVNYLYKKQLMIVNNSEKKIIPVCYIALVD